MSFTGTGCRGPGAASANFVLLGPQSAFGTGGGGAGGGTLTVSGKRITGRYTIPGSYLTSDANGARIVPFAAGDQALFVFYPAGICSAPFTVTAGARSLPFTGAPAARLLTIVALALLICGAALRWAGREPTRPLGS